MEQEQGDLGHPSPQPWTHFGLHSSTCPSTLFLCSQLLHVTGGCPELPSLEFSSQSSTGHFLPNSRLCLVWKLASASFLVGTEDGEERVPGRPKDWGPGSSWRKTPLTLTLGLWLKPWDQCTLLCLPLHSNSLPEPRLAWLRCPDRFRRQAVSSKPGASILSLSRGMGQLVCSARPPHWMVE